MQGEKADPSFPISFASQFYLQYSDCILMWGSVLLMMRRVFSDPFTWLDCPLQVHDLSSVHTPGEAKGFATHWELRFLFGWQKALALFLQLWDKLVSSADSSERDRYSLFRQFCDGEKCWSTIDLFVPLQKWGKDSRNCNILDKYSSPKYYRSLDPSIQSV